MSGWSFRMGRVSVAYVAVAVGGHGDLLCLNIIICHPQTFVNVPREYIPGRVRREGGGSRRQETPVRPRDNVIYYKGAEPQGIPSAARKRRTI